MLLKSLCRVHKGPEFLSLPQRVAPGPEAAEPAHQQEWGAQAGRLWAGARIRHTCQVRGPKAGVTGPEMEVTRVADPDPDSIEWIRIRNPDPDSGGQK
jgi:hypothetical protein